MFAFQICVLQQIGILTIWSIIQEKLKSLTPDIGKMAWSRLKLEKKQSVNLSDYVYENIVDNEIKFNIAAAKKRLAAKRIEKNILKMERQSSNFEMEDRLLSHTSSSSSIYNNVRPVSAASYKKSKILVENIFDNSTIFYCLKVMKLNRTVNFLVGKTCGEVMHCTRFGNIVKVNIINAASKLILLNNTTIRAMLFYPCVDPGPSHRNISTDYCLVTDERRLIRVS